MPYSRDDVVAVVRSVFPGHAVDHILALLDGYGVRPFARERERVQLAILTLSEGDEAKLREFLAVAKRDYRDVLFWAEYPEEAKVNTPEKRQQVRELFKKLGLTPPHFLDE